MSSRAYGSGVDRVWRGPDDCIVRSMLDDDGLAPCADPDDCSLCGLLSQQRPDETRRQWTDRITGRALQLAALVDEGKTRR